MTVPRGGRSLAGSGDRGDRGDRGGRGGRGSRVAAQEPSSPPPRIDTAGDEGPVTGELAAHESRGPPPPLVTPEAGGSTSGEAPDSSRAALDSSGAALDSSGVAPSSSTQAKKRGRGITKMTDSLDSLEPTDQPTAADHLFFNEWNIPEGSYRNKLISTLGAITRAAAKV